MEGDKDSSGIYIRVCRDGEWDAVDITDLTKEQLGTFFEGRSKEDVLRFLFSLGQIMKENSVDASSLNKILGGI